MSRLGCMDAPFFFFFFLLFLFFFSFLLAAVSRLCRSRNSSSQSRGWVRERLTRFICGSCCFQGRFFFLQVLSDYYYLFRFLFCFGFFFLCVRLSSHFYFEFPALMPLSLLESY